MPVLQLIYAPDPIFAQKAQPIAKITDATNSHVQDMLDTLYFEKAVGIAANMIGLLERIAIVDLMENDQPKPIIMINPTITWRSEDTQSHDEASICYPYISAKITRAAAITVEFQDRKGAPQSLTAEGFLATAIQHEIDYLDGIVFLDHLSRTKRTMLLKKMQKLVKANPPHIHGTSCNH